MESNRKLISINISGIIFYVEEDGFEKLKNYLSAIGKYFAPYPNSAELMADIEGRIAEFLLAKIEYPKEYISLRDIDELIATMGTIADFNPSDYEQEEAGRPIHLEKEPFSGDMPKRLLRDERRKVLGGVASGIAHYFDIDPLWIRLTFLLVFFDMGSILEISGVAAIIYAILWAVVPGSRELEENEQLRRFYRDTEHKVVGGVAGGIALYFGIDITLVRLAFVFSMFLGGVGLLTYLVLWAITPPARTITERMQMQGEPITLENIERFFREQIRLDDQAQEDAWVRRLMVPFRLGASVVDYIGQHVNGRTAFRTGWSAISVLVGGGMALTSFAASVGLSTAFGALMGWLPAGFVNVEDVPLDIIRSTIPTLPIVFGFITAWVPFAFLGIAGASLVAQRIVTPRFMNWSLLALWSVGIIGSVMTIPLVASDFQAEGVRKEQFVYDVADNAPLRLSIDQLDQSQLFFGNASLTILGHAEPKAILEQKIEARGCSRQQAIENTNDIVYEVEMDGSNMLFDNRYALKSDRPYRDQRVRMTLYMPYGKEFVMGPEMANLLRNTLTPNGYSARDLREENTWVFQENGLHCITCKEVGERKRYIEGQEGALELGTFTKVDVEEDCKVLIRQGSEHAVSVENAKGRTPFRFYVKDDVLYVRREDGGRRALAIITVPFLENIKLEGSSELTLEGIKQDALEIELSEASKCSGDIFAEKLAIDISEGSKISLSGACESINIKAEEGAVADLSGMVAESMKVRAEEGVRMILGKTGTRTVVADESCHIEE